MTTPAARSPSRDPRTPGQVLRGLVPSVYAPTLLEFVGLAALMPVIPLLARELGFSVPQAAALTVIFGLSSFLGPIPAGRLIDRIGARRALMVTGALLVVSNLAAFALIGPALGAGAATIGHRLALIGLLLVMAVSMQVWQLGRQTYLGTALPPSLRARGMTLFGGVIRIGQVIGPLLGALVMALGSMAGVFLLFAISAAAGTVMIAVFLPPGESGPEPAAPQERSRRRSPARIHLDRAVLGRMLLVGLGIAPVMMARVNRPVIVPLLGDALGLDPVWISIVFGVSAVLEILLVLPAGTLMDRYGRAAVAVPCALLMGLGFLLLGLLGTVLAGSGTALAILALLVPTLLIGLGNGLGSGIVMTLGIDVSPVHGRTRYLAWWNTMLGAGRLAAPLIVTGITLFAPVAVAGAATGAICLAGGLWLTRILPRVTPSGSTRGR
ncbi:arabinose ABC transporter permease [Brachybacterium avium]|uniref:Arabinose ABC transporter permease n=1 Tax=Brachybacterium avium TaxID=2017485 RepID=A0A220UE94_9MICO|nr:MFS transporter [Brachybacterium avium]ASK66528.1 arabinose ABC transporter permease [Brachybacterium avium]